MNKIILAAGLIAASIPSSASASNWVEVALRCPSRTYMELKKTFFERSGSSTEIQVSKEWDFAIPDTVMDGVFDKVCE